VLIGAAQERRIRCPFETKCDLKKALTDIDDQVEAIKAAVPRAFLYESLCPKRPIAAVSSAWNIGPVTVTCSGITVKSSGKNGSLHDPYRSGLRIQQFRRPIDFHGVGHGTWR
jgi:hypothetical protein